MQKINKIKNGSKVLGLASWSRDCMFMVSCKRQLSFLQSFLYSRGRDSLLNLEEF
jgi:hypothetical protein